MKRLVLLLIFSGFSPEIFSSPVVNKLPLEGDVKVKCISGNCPASLGTLLIFIKNTEKQGGYFVDSCTAFLVGPQRVVSNAHCDLRSLPVEEVVFMSSDGRMVSVEKTISRSLSETDLLLPGEKIAGWPDLASFALSEPLYMDEYYRWGVSLSERVKHTLRPTVFFLKTSQLDVGEDQSLTVTYETIKCNHNPLDLESLSFLRQGTTSMGLSQCPVVTGNSGAPMVLSPESMSVFAVAHTIKIFDGAQISRQRNHRRIALTTLASCFEDIENFNESSCPYGDIQENKADQRRFLVKQMTALIGNEESFVLNVASNERIFIERDFVFKNPYTDLPKSGMDPPLLKITWLFINSCG